MLQDYEQVLGADAAGTTITRIRGRIAWAYFPETSLQEPLIASWGIRVDESQVTNLTDTQQVERLQQHYADWLMYEQRYVWPSVEGEGLVSPNLIHEDVVDIRSQRRLDELQQSLYFVAGVPGIAAGRSRSGELQHPPEEALSRVADRLLAALAVWLAVLTPAPSGLPAGRGSACRPTVLPSLSSRA